LDTLILLDTRSLAVTFDHQSNEEEKHNFKEKQIENDE